MGKGHGSANGDELERGRLLFNAGRYFEAHETWEEAWLVERGDARVLLQGLIQVAAGCHKAGQGKAAGCARLIAAGLARLERAAGFAPGLAEFQREMADVHARALRWQRGEETGAGPIPFLPPRSEGPAPGVTAG